MKIIALTETQKIGFQLFDEKVRIAQNNIQEFALKCLEEGGGQRMQPWKWNAAQLQWEMDDSSSQQS
jgi:hypothetical protein